MEQQVVAEVSVAPLGTGSTSLSGYVAACLDTLKEVDDISYQLTAMGTILQGPLERVLEVVARMHQVPFDMGAQRVLTSLRIDDRRDKPVTIQGKVEAVQRRRP